MDWRPSSPTSLLFRSFPSSPVTNWFKQLVGECECERMGSPTGVFRGVKDVGFELGWGGVSSPHPTRRSLPRDVPGRVRAS